jgi:(1->4)-alpha-D-glucan 1-alpha-D-glucosylmutase
LFYQTIVGAWPAELHRPETLPEAEVADFRQRVADYMIKAVREAKVKSSWINPNEDYENALLMFIEKVLDPKRRDTFWSEFLDFQGRIAEIGTINALAQVALKLTVPGVPDIYQGCEGWDLSLVDPDNRRPVDFGRHSKQLSDLSGRFDNDPLALAKGLLGSWPDGAIKVFITWRLLSLRRDEPSLFADGAYHPAIATGSRADNIVAFVREHEGRRILTVVPRLVASMMGDAEGPPVGPGSWGDTTVVINGVGGSRHWRNVFTGQEVVERDEAGGAALDIVSVLDSFPIGVFVNDEGIAKR